MKNAKMKFILAFWFILPDDKKRPNESNTHYLQNLRCRKSNPPKIESFVICRPKTASFFEPGCKSKLDNYSLPSTLLPGNGDNRGSLQFRYFA